MQRLVFRDRKKGSVVLSILKGALPGFSAENPHTYKTFGIPFSKTENPSGVDPLFTNYQHLQLIFEVGESPQSPPFSFFIGDKTPIQLPTKALNDKVFMASWESRQWMGELEIGLTNGKGEVIWKLETEIIPPHLPYKEEQAFMFGELEEWMRGLSRAHEKPVSTSVGSELAWYQKDLMFEVIEEKWVEDFLEQLEMLEADLDENWTFGGKWVQNSRVNPKLSQAGIHVREGGKTWVKKKSRSKHTSLNKWVQQSLLRLLSFASASDLYPGLAQKTKAFLQNHFPPSISSPVLVQPTYLPPAYQRWYRSYLNLFRRLSLKQLSLFKIALKDLPLLYEYWCFLKLAALIGQLTQAQLRQQDLLFFEQGKGVSRLAHGQQLHFLYDSLDGESELELWYQREGKTELGVHKPDIWLEIRKKGVETPFIYFFDVKFQVKEIKEKEAGSSFSAPKEALNQLHRYRDALLTTTYQDEKGTYASKAFGGAVLFPYPNEEETFSSHPQYLQLWENGIGAIPLQPRPYASHQLLRHWLQDLLDASTEALFERMIMYDKREQNIAIERFSQPLSIKESGSWDEDKREWKGEKLHGEGPMPETSNQGAKEAALRYKQLHLFWVPEYLGLRLWQELVKEDPEAHWTSRGLNCQINEKKWSISLAEEAVQLKAKHSTVSLPRSLGVKEIIERIKKA